jgi:hypothetical protein
VISGGEQNSVTALASRLESIGREAHAHRRQAGPSSAPGRRGQVRANDIGGLNPVAILEARGEKAHSRALAGLVDFRRCSSTAALRTV